MHATDVPEQSLARSASQRVDGQANRRERDAMSTEKSKARRAPKNRRIRRPEFVEIPIETQGGQLGGWLRVEAHRIMWGDKVTRRWRGVSLDSFIQWINDPKASNSTQVESRRLHRVPR
jgi:hypothetical protein